jgi:D-alanyl-lipoteichoic acid acyltransferase DltB (MBOAT superfamily)
VSFVDDSFPYLLAATFAVWWLVRGHHAATVTALLIASLIFYGHDRWWLIALIISCAVVDWAAALWIVRSRRPRVALAAGVGFNLALLCFWKYAPLLSRSVSAAAGWLSLALEPLSSDWYVPFGLSFYAFTGIAYLVDVHRRNAQPERSLPVFSFYLTFFPHLVAGPILRTGDFLVHLQPQTLPRRPQAPLEASLLVARGYFKKMVLADRIAAAIDPFFLHVGGAATEGVWSLPYVYLYALQIYLDFSAYTDIARGLALFFGFRWPENFHLPYLAASIRDFWRRWHVTLSRFLRDYVYVPLGGSRRGRGRTAANIMITMLLGGLWHGGTWSFLLWGGIHGSMLLIHRAWTATRLGERLARLRGLAGAIWHTAAIALTFHCVCAAWCFFRLTDPSRSLVCLRQWADFAPDRILVGGAADPSVWSLLAVYALVTTAARALFGPLAAGDLDLDARLSESPAWRGIACGVAAAALLLAILLAPSSDAQPFIYFQF